MLNLNSSLLKLNQDRHNQTIKKLNQEGIHTIEDLLWVIPLHWDLIPEINHFTTANKDQYFRGEGQIISRRTYNSKQKGKGGTRLYHMNAYVQDRHGPGVLILKWHNIYPSQKNKIEQVKNIQFFGKAQFYQTQLQITMPTLIDSENGPSAQIQIQYPTINGVSSNQVKNLLRKIPKDIWISIEDPLPEYHLKKINLCHLQDAFKIIHGNILNLDQLNPELLAKAKRRLIYQEFYWEQIKVDIRRNNNQKKVAPIIKISKQTLQKIINSFPYKLTSDQNKTVQDIVADIQSGTPMMRMLQGDVGCGKTTVAFIAALMAALNHHQTALMCPTETLAMQHYQKADLLLKKFDLNCHLFIGSQSSKKKKNILKKISDGHIDFIIGTHTLFQNSVEFKDLALTIIDEQHKFGVNQRVQLSNKGPGGHTLIMTATPIPRSLSLTHYGDLEISTIKTLPAQRKEVQTRIITPTSFEKFLSFTKTRMEMGEQIFIVAPAIEENPDHELITIQKIFKRFNNFFPQNTIQLLHGKLDSNEKQAIFTRFVSGEIQILIATSVIEVGIDVANATIMAIMGPERFGLSSLHQLRGRVGRGGRPGFCFLITDSNNSDSLRRLRVIEQTSNGFEIAEADLALRGEGDVFGLNQSGREIRRLANIVRDQDILHQVKKDIPLLQNSPLYLSDYKKISKELSVILTI